MDHSKDTQISIGAKDLQLILDAAHWSLDYWRAGENDPTLTAAAEYQALLDHMDTDTND